MRLHPQYKAHVRGKLPSFRRMVGSGEQILRTIDCQQCQQPTPLGRAFNVAGESLCEPCVQTRLVQNPELKSRPDAIARLIDPTVCWRCGADGGEIELPTLAALPFCETCAQAARRFPFPAWIKLATIAVAALVLFGLYRNDRFFTAYLALHRMERAADAGQVEEAYHQADLAARRVPERPEIAALAALFHGAWLVQQDRSTEALPLLRAAQQARPQEDLAPLILQAEAYAAFDAQDYDNALEKMNVIRARLGESPMPVLAVASAYACKYAVSGDEAFRQRAHEQIDLALRLPDSDTPDVREYVMRIRHRLATREIIKREEFLKRYPSGWNNEEPK